MVDFVRLSAIVGNEYLQSFLVGQDAVAKSRELLRITEEHLRQSSKLLGRRDECHREMVAQRDSGTARQTKVFA
ncbi:hypothetical protein [Rhizobium sp. NXC24]|uniref:hypothetical protein n=1 Tax=Rhizobium sp. NXC24 TaxID=2048897 RepID=UPI00131A4FAB|nr:hypothetical protein [Rhizobium sp. NXC24]